MKWSKEKPKKTGWYWYRDSVIETPFIGKLQGSCISFPHGMYIYVDDAPGEFAGPIPEPEE